LKKNIAFGMWKDSKMDVKKIREGRKFKILDKISQNKDCN
jgi:hypothetical protein